MLKRDFWHTLLVCPQEFSAFSGSLFVSRRTPFVPAVALRAEEQSGTNDHHQLQMQSQAIKSVKYERRGKNEMSVVRDWESRQGLKQDNLRRDTSLRRQESLPAPESFETTLRLRQSSTFSAVKTPSSVARPHQHHRPFQPHSVS